MKVLITGATGLIGKEIVSLCHERDISVNYLTTRKSKIENKTNYQGFFWSPKTGDIDAECLNGVDAIINLVGATIAKRWTAKYKKEVVNSRVQTAELLFKTLKKSKHSVKQIVSASAIGIYPDSLTNYYNEDYKDVDQSFLGEVVEKWEAAVNQFQDIGIMVSKVRIGLVLSEKGGALPHIVKTIKYGVGSAFGKGDQWQSWIHVTDLAQLFMYVIKHKISGVVNGVSPNTSTNKDFTKTIAKVINRPLILPNIPRFMMKFIIGEMHMILFASQRVSSKKIENLGFNFKYYTLESALQNILK